MSEPIKATTADTATAAANTAVAITYAADATKRHVVEEIIASYDAAPTGGTLKIEDGAGTTVFLADVGQNPPPITFSPPLMGSYNTAMIITLAAGGGSVVGKLNVRHRTH